MYRNHPLWAKLREICYVDKWLCHTRPFPDFKCFCTSGFFCFFFFFCTSVFYCPISFPIFSTSEGSVSPLPRHGSEEVASDTLRSQGLKGRIAGWMNTKFWVWLLPFPISQTMLQVNPMQRKPQASLTVWWRTPGPPQVPWPPSLQYPCTSD